MKGTFLAWTGVLLILVTAGCQRQKTTASSASTGQAERAFQARGVIKEIVPGSPKIVVEHEAVAGYMPAMTMPFRVRDTNQLSGLRAGDQIDFRLVVKSDESWIDQVTRIGTRAAAVAPAKLPEASTNASVPTIADIPDFALTNELGAPVKLRHFKGQAVAMTFFFTRCPIPEYCPRLSRNFAEASQTMAAQPGGPTNYHFLSVSFDPLDTPAVLRNYARQYGYDSNHWSFITGDPAHVRALTRGFGLSVTEQSGTITHDFRTVLFDANGRVQAIWPIGGNATDLLVREMTKAASVQPVQKQPPIDDK